MANVKDPAYYQQFMVTDFGLWKLYVHEEQYYLGRLYLWSVKPGSVDLVERNNYELIQLQLILKRVKKALDEMFAPLRYNYAALGNEAEHCHVHLIPRYQPGRTLQYCGVDFQDENTGRNYAPYPKKEYPLELLMQLRSDLERALVAKAAPVFYSP